MVLNIFIASDTNIEEINNNNNSDNNEKEDKLNINNIKFPQLPNTILKHPINIQNKNIQYDKEDKLNNKKFAKNKKIMIFFYIFFILLIIVNILTKYIKDTDQNIIFTISFLIIILLTIILLLINLLILNINVVFSIIAILIFTLTLGILCIIQFFKNNTMITGYLSNELVKSILLDNNNIIKEMTYSIVVSISQIFIIIICLLFCFFCEIMYKTILVIFILTLCIVILFFFYKYVLSQPTQNGS